MANNEVKTTGENLNKEPTVSKSVESAYGFRHRILCTLALAGLAAVAVTSPACDTGDNPDPDPIVGDDDTEGDDDDTEPINSPPEAPNANNPEPVAWDAETVVVTGEIPDADNTDRLEYSVDGGEWVVAEDYNAGDNSFEVEIPLPAEKDATIALRTANESGTQGEDEVDVERLPNAPDVHDNPISIEGGSFSTTVTVEGTATHLNVFDGEGGLVKTIDISNESAEVDVTVTDATSGIYTFVAVRNIDDEDYPGAEATVPAEAVNTAPEITSLEATPNPVEIFGETEVFFSADDADGDGMAYDLNLSNGDGAVLSNPSNGTCDTDTHCSGTMTPGETVTVDMETADSTNATLNLEVDDGNGGIDTDDRGVTIW